MRSFLLIGLIFIPFLIIAQQPWRPGEMQVKVYPETTAQADCLTPLNGEVAGDFIRCYLTPDELLRLQQQGLRCEVEVNDLNALSASFGERSVPTGYYTVAQLHAIADSLAQNFPDICTLHTIGIAGDMSPLKALKISDNSAMDENEAEILFDGGIHGDEIGGPENLIRFARDLCLQYGVDDYITNLVNNREIWVYYCVNPYGRNNMTRYNASGVDINRDCGYMWNSEGNSPGPFSQPETKAYRNLLKDNQFVIHCSYHSGTEYISYPWSYRAEATPDAQIHLLLAQTYAQNSGYANIPYGQGYNGMYAINGSTKDFGYGALGSISWSVEISVSKQPPASQIVPFYLKNKDAMLSMVENAGYGIQGTVIDSMTHQPIAANIWVNDLYFVANDPLVGDFHKFLLPGTYTVRIDAAGHESKTIEGVTVSALSATIVDVTLKRASGSFAKRVLGCYIPNNNPLDEGYTLASLGAPDQVRYSLGRNGYAVFDMGDTLTPAAGPEVKIYENDDTPEGYLVMAGPSPDGPWVLMGTGSGYGEFDLPASMPQARYIRIKDDGDGVNQAPDAGFDLDAVEYIPHPATDTTGIVEGFAYFKYGDYLQPAAGAEVFYEDQIVLADDFGHFTIEIDTGNRIIAARALNPLSSTDTTVFVVANKIVYQDLVFWLWEKADNMDKPVENLKIYPNPAVAEVNIQAVDPGKVVMVQVFNSEGIQVFVERNPTLNNTGTYRFDTSTLSPGLYLVRIVLLNGSASTGRFLVGRH